MASTRERRVAIVLSFLLLAGMQTNATDYSDVHVSVVYFAGWHDDEWVDPDLGPCEPNTCLHPNEWVAIDHAWPWADWHLQPKVPLWGYLHDDTVAAWRDYKLPAMYQNGVDSFIYYFYWFEGYTDSSGEHMFLEHALEDGYLQAPNMDRVDFMICLANHDQCCYNGPPCQLSADFSDAGWNQMADYVVTNYFAKSNYRKVNGMPVFYVWDPSRVSEDQRQYLRSRAIAAGFPDVDIRAAQSGWPAPGLPYEDYEPYFSAVCAHQPPLYERERHVTVYTGRDWAPRNQNDVPQACFQAPNWREQDSPLDAVLVNNGPDVFYYALRTVADAAVRNGEDLVIYNWNEWGEGSFLEPELTYGEGFLDAIHRLKTNRSIGRRWDFLSMLEGWSANGNVANLQWSKDGDVRRISGDITGPDPYLYRAGLAIPISGCKRLRIAYKSSNSGEAEVFFATQDFPSWDASRSVSFAMAASSEYQSVDLDMSAVPGWSGTLTNLRFDPAGSNGSFSIDSIEIVRGAESILIGVDSTAVPGLVEVSEGLGSVTAAAAGPISHPDFFGDCYWTAVNDYKVAGLNALVSHPGPPGGVCGMPCDTPGQDFENSPDSPTPLTITVTGIPDTCTTAPNHVGVYVRYLTIPGHPDLRGVRARAGGGPWIAFDQNYGAHQVTREFPSAAVGRNQTRAR